MLEREFAAGRPNGIAAGTDAPGGLRPGRTQGGEIISSDQL